MYILKFICVNCQQRSKENMARPIAERVAMFPIEFDNLTEATEHILSTRISDGKSHILETSILEE